jgi:hypothetical protein
VSEIQGWPNRRTVVRALGITPKRLADLVAIGELTPTRDFHGRHRFDPVQVTSLRKRLERPPGPRAPRSVRPTGAVCAAIFRAFEDRVEPRELVKTFEVTPEVIARLRREYAELGRDLLVPPAQLLELRELLDLGGEITARALVGAVAERLRRQYQSGRASGLAEVRKPETKDVSSGKRYDEEDGGTDGRRREKGARGDSAG